MNVKQKSSTFFQARSNSWDVNKNRKYYYYRLTVRFAGLRKVAGLKMLIISNKGHYSIIKYPHSAWGHKGEKNF